MSAANRLPLFVLLAIIAVGWLDFEGQKAGYYDAGLGWALFALAALIVLIVVIVASARSIHAADLEHRISEEKFRLAVESAPNAIIKVDRDGAITLVNTFAERLFGYTREELVGRPIETLIPQRYRAGHPSLFRGFFSDPKPRWMGIGRDLSARRKDGSEFPAEIGLSPIQTSQGLRVIASIVDISPRKRLEQEVRQAQERLREVVVSSPAVLYTLEGKDAPSLILTWISENVTEMMGYSVEEVMRPDWWHDRVHPDELDRILREIGESVFGRGRLAQEYRFRHHDGEYRWVRSEMRMMRDASGQPKEVVGSWSDITEQKLMENQFRQAQKMEAVGRLAGGIAHDFNNLLTAILGFIELTMARLPAGDPSQGMLDQGKRAAERAALLTRRLLVFSRKQVLQPTVLDLNLLLAEMEKMLHRLIGEDVEIAIKAAPGLWPIKADAGQIEQVVMNLAVNARDAMPTGGKLTIETVNIELDATYASLHAESRAGAHVRLAVSDTGCGMDAATRSRLFEPFFTTKGPEKGTGLGLATVFGIVKQTGGHIEVYSEPGLGATFKIYLPRDPEGIAVPATRGRFEVAPGGTETLLLAEDEEGVRALAKMVLESKGYTVLEARDGVEALAICEKSAGPIHLVLTDVVMPHMSGRQLVEHLTRVRPGIKVLYLSGYTDDAVVRHGILQAGVPFLQKPFTPEELAHKVRSLLDQ